MFHWRTDWKHISAQRADPATSSTVLRNAGYNFGGKELAICNTTPKQKSGTPRFTSDCRGTMGIKRNPTASPGSGSCCVTLPPIVVDRRFHIFTNSIPYPKGSLNVLIAHFGTFSCKCGIRTEINSLFNKRGSKRRKSNSHSRREFLRFFYAHFQNKLFAYLEKHACPAL